MESVLFSIAVALPLLITLVVLHELGHFIAARCFGIKVLEFGVGIPPRAWGFYTGRTEVAINGNQMGLRLDSERTRGYQRGKRVVVWSRERADGSLEAVIVAPIKNAKKYDTNNLDKSLLRHEGRIRELSCNHLVLADMIYSINWLPFGGFVRPAGENSMVPRGMESKPPWQRLIVLFAGVTVNLALVPILFTAVFMFPHDVGTGRIEVSDVNPSGAAHGHMLPGDTLTSINDVSLDNSDIGRVPLELFKGGDSEAVIELDRDGIQQTVTLQPEYTELDNGTHAWAIGVEIKLEDAVVETKSLSPPRALLAGLVHTGSLLIGTGQAIGDAASHRTNPMAGPVGIVDMVGDVSRDFGLRGWLLMGALLSFGLALFNIIPIPVTDGGRAVFVLIEWIRGGKRLSDRVMSIAYQVGIGFILVILLLVTFGDIVRITAVEIGFVRLLISLLAGVGLGTVVGLSIRRYLSRRRSRKAESN